MTDVSMSTTQKPPPRLAARIAPAVGLFFLAPWVGEYLLGNVSVREIAALPFLAPLYGGGVLLIREVVRRTGRGWPTILLLGLAYGVIEAGLVDQSLFNPSFEGHDFLAVTPVPWLGISASNAMAFVVGHAVWSIGVPIAVMEMLVPDRRRSPWLGPVGLIVTAAIYALGCVIIFQELYDSERFLATPAQRIVSAATALVLVVVAFAATKSAAMRPPAVGDGRVPRHPRRLGVVAFVVASAFLARPENWVGVVVGIIGIYAVSRVVVYWSRQRLWGIRQEFALVAGAMLTYAWAGFALTSLFEPGDPVRWLGNAAFALTAIALLALTGWRLNRPEGSRRSSDRSAPPRRGTRRGHSGS